ncbi:hypothetical protein BDM02DRAFT_3107779 [Thelephora ganbajun]|uniref:Uncharacterized protein n=1 Tax=Thelephora ganbajun TaxID=370292 RepID=A0ACB6ZTV1_THEGA|nr:hypothetical protein BDM02DRAFT_3107779 [Thelephora ganbajun]
MTPDFSTSSDALPTFAQSYTGDLIIPEVEQPSLPPNATVVPSWLYGDEGPFQSSTSLCIPGGNHYQRPSPAPSTSTDVWMGHTGDEASVSVSTPVSPAVGSGDDILGDFPSAQHYFTTECKSAHPDTLMSYCICGCGGGACIPQRDYDRPRADPLTRSELREMIPFSVNKKCGYPLKDALQKLYTGLDGRDDKMFVSSKSSISIRVEWLPYDKWTKQIRTLTWRKKPDNITRAKLATEVAKRMKAFFEEMRDKAADPSYREYCIQPGVIDFDHLELVALKRVAKSSYMPHFRLISPPQSFLPTAASYSMPLLDTTTYVSRTVHNQAQHLVH